jgi:hypothetical protein
MKHFASTTRKAVVLSGLAIGVALHANSQEVARPSELLGHWRTTVIIGDAPLDRNLVLKADGSAVRWTVTAQRRDPPESGTWSVTGRALVLSFGGQTQQSPFTFHNGQLVLPNVQGRRRFWDRL